MDRAIEDTFVVLVLGSSMSTRQTKGPVMVLRFSVPIVTDGRLGLKFQDPKAAKKATSTNEF